MFTSILRLAVNVGSVVGCHIFLFSLSIIDKFVNRVVDLKVMLKLQLYCVSTYAVPGWDNYKFPLLEY